MKPLHLLLGALLLFAAAGEAEKTAKVNLNIHLDAFRLVHIAQDRAEAEIDLSVITDMSGRIDRIDFGNIHANGVPFFAQPLDVPLDLHRGQRFSLPPIAVTVYTGDLDSLDPLMVMLDQRRTRLIADLAIRVQASLLEHLVLGDAHPLAFLAIDQEVDVQPPGGLLGRASAMALLKAAQIARAGATHSPILVLPSDPAWRTQMNIARAALLQARACYTAGRKNANEVCVDRLAFAVDAQNVISTAELSKPWRFTPQLAQSLVDEGGQVQSGDPRFSIKALGAESTVSLARLESTGIPSELKVILLPSRSRLTLLDPQSPGVYSLLHVTTLGMGLTFHMLAGQPDCGRLAIFRLSRTPDGEWFPRATYLSGAVSRQTVTFSRPVDRSAIGSPILTPQGVIGVVQSETVGTLLSAAR